MVLPGIPKPKRNVAVIGPNAKKRDKNRYINVSRVMRERIDLYNSNVNGSHERYVPFPDDERSDIHRNRDAFQVVDDVLSIKLLYKNENGKKKSYYGTHTSPELPPELLRKVVIELKGRMEMHVYTQAQNDWAIKKLIEQKMYSKSKRYRQSMRKNNIQRSQENTAVVHTNSIPDGDTDHDLRDYVKAQENQSDREHPLEVSEAHDDDDTVREEAIAAVRAQESFRIAEENAFRQLNPQKHASTSFMKNQDLNNEDEICIQNREAGSGNVSDLGSRANRDSNRDDVMTPYDDKEADSEEERILQLELRLARLRRQRRSASSNSHPSSITLDRENLRVRALFKPPRNLNSH